MTDAPLAWFDTYLRGEDALPSHRPVTIEVQGEAGGWRELDDWPPPADAKRWHLHPGGSLAPETPGSPSPPDPYRYDPADPTPSIGGIGMLTGGPVDNRELEARPDVLVYTSDRLTDPLVLIGPVEAELWVNSSLDHTDFFVRLCDVSPDGRSINVCDGLRRLDPSSILRSADGTFSVSVPMWPVGHRFGAGHRLRVQVSSGAHPVYARNLGTGEPVATATFMQPAEQAVFREPGKLSFVTLPHASS
jgi:putative CocE/NonD family hydrolase